MKGELSFVLYSSECRGELTILLLNEYLAPLTQGVRRAHSSLFPIQNGINLQLAEVSSVEAFVYR